MVNSLLYCIFRCLTLIRNKIYMFYKDFPKYIFNHSQKKTRSQLFGPPITCMTMWSLWTSNKWSLISTPFNMVNPVSPAIIMPSSTNFVSSMVNDRWDQLRSPSQHKTYCYFSLGWQLEQRFSQGCLQDLTIGEGFRAKHVHLCVKYRLETPRMKMTFSCFIWGSPSAKKSKKKLNPTVKFW